MSSSVKAVRRIAFQPFKGKQDSQLNSPVPTPPVEPAESTASPPKPARPPVPKLPLSTLRPVPIRSSKVAHLPSGASAAKGGGAVVGRIGTLLVYVETEARNALKPVKVWLVETIATIRGSIEARAGPVVEKLRASGEPVVVYLTPIYAKAADGVVRLQAAVGDRAIVVKARALQLKGACASEVLAAYGAACEAAEARRRAVCLLAVTTIDPYKEKALHVYDAGKARALPYYVKGKDAVYPYYKKVQGGCQCVETRVAGMVLKIKVEAGEKAALVKSAALARYTAPMQFIGSFTGPVLSKLAAMYKAVEAHVATHLSAILAKAQSCKAVGWTKVCDVAVAVKVKSLAVKDSAMKCPSAVYVQVKNGYVYMEGVVDGRVVVAKAKLADVANSTASHVLKARDQASGQAAAAVDAVRVKCLALRAESRRLAADPNARATAASAVGGAAVMGTGGLVTGGALGAMCGIPLCLFTFGLSIPVGAVIGGGTGMCAGATAGLVSGGAAGHKIHKEKEVIAEGLASAATKVSDVKDMAAAKALAYASQVTDSTAASAAYVRAKFAGGTGGTGEDK